MDSIPSKHQALIILIKQQTVIIWDQKVSMLVHCTFKIEFVKLKILVKQRKTIDINLYKICNLMFSFKLKDHIERKTNPENQIIELLWKIPAVMLILISISSLKFSK